MATIEAQIDLNVSDRGLEVGDTTICGGVITDYGEGEFSARVNPDPLVCSKCELNRYCSGSKLESQTV